MHNAFFIVGPTAVGKTGVAVEIAERHKAEIVSADAYQVYRGFDLLTAKPTPEQRRRVVHHLVDCLDLAETWNVARFLEVAQSAIQQARQNGRPIIVVGGNGLYVKALTHGLSPLPESQPALRMELESKSPAELLARLRELDPLAYERIEHRNLRRIVRAVEVCLLTGKPFSSYQTGWANPVPGGLPTGVFLSREREDLVALINERVDAMFTSGVVEEVRRVPADTLSATARQILGIAEVQALLAGRISLTECRDRIKAATWQYAKRQVTWFKRETCFATVTCVPQESAGASMELIHEHFLAWQRVVSPDAGTGSGDTSRHTQPVKEE